MRQKQIKRIEHQQRQTIPPQQPAQQNLINRTRHHRPNDNAHPHTPQNPHISVLSILMRLARSATRDPSQSASKDTILNRRQIRIGLDDHDELDVEAVAGFGPAADGDEGVEEGGDGEGQIVVANVLGSAPEHENSGEGVHEDGERDGRVVHHAGEIADFLDRGETAFPEIGVGEEGRGALWNLEWKVSGDVFHLEGYWRVCTYHTPPHLLTEKRPWRVWAYATG